MNMRQSLDSIKTKETSTVYLLCNSFKAENIVANVHTAFREMLQGDDWMDNETKMKAVEKVDAVTRLIGYPDWFHNTSAIDMYYGQVV